MYVVVSISGEIGGRPVIVDAERRCLLPLPVPRQVLKHSGRHQWNLSAYRSDNKGMEVAIWLNKFFDDMTDAEWEEWETYSDSLSPIHEEDRRAERLQKEQALQKYKEDWERRRGEPCSLSDVDILCNIPKYEMPRDIESIKARFEKRLGEIREHLNRTVSSRAERSAGGEGPVTLREGSAELVPR
jgi:hypothetical protein